VSVCLSVCVCPCPSQVGVLLKRIELIFGMEALFHYPTLYCKEIRVTQKMKELPSGTLSKMLDLQNFVTVAGLADC